MAARRIAAPYIPAVGALDQHVGVRRGDEPSWLIEARGRVADREARLVLESRHPICIAELASEVHHGYQSPLAVVSAACAYMGVTGVLELIEILTPRLTRWDIDELSGVSLLAGGLSVEIRNIECRNRLMLRKGELLQAAMTTALLTGREQMAEVLAFHDLHALRAGVSYAPAVQRAVQAQARFLPSFVDALAEHSAPGSQTWAWGRLVMAAAGFYGLPDAAVFGMRWLMREEASETQLWAAMGMCIKHARRAGVDGQRLLRAVQAETGLWGSSPTADGAV